MPINTIEKLPPTKSSAELEIGRWLGRWNRANLEKSRTANLEVSEEKLVVEKIMPFILNPELRQKGMAENDPYAWKADTFLLWIEKQGLTLPKPETKPLEHKQVAA